jgi:hypothetical protein
MPNTFIVVALGFLLTKSSFPISHSLPVLTYVPRVVYVCSFLAMLNSRQRTRRPSEEASNGIPRHLPKLRSVSFRSYSLRSAPAPSAYAQVRLHILLISQSLNGSYRKRYPGTKVTLGGRLSRSNHFHVSNFSCVRSLWLTVLWIEHLFDYLIAMHHQFFALNCTIA